MTLDSFYQWQSGWRSEAGRMPVFFIGHGSPMNAIEDNVFSAEWRRLAHTMPRPSAVLVISAHWLTRGSFVTAMDAPPTIHDFRGFPKALFEVNYPAPGEPALANALATGVTMTEVGLDHEWGLDHGTWSIVRHMYPDADIPVLQFSIDYSKPADYHYQLARELQQLRQKGVLIIGSGNMVHNLRMVAWDKLAEPEYGYDWALELNERLKNAIVTGDHRALVQYEKFGQAAALAIPTPDHYYPLLYAAALADGKDTPEIFNDRAVGGSLTMTSVKWS